MIRPQTPGSSASSDGTARGRGDAQGLERDPRSGRDSASHSGDAALAGSGRRFQRSFEQALRDGGARADLRGQGRDGRSGGRDDASAGREPSGALPATVDPAGENGARRQGEGESQDRERLLAVSAPDDAAGPPFLPSSLPPAAPVGVLPTVSEIVGSASPGGIEARIAQIGARIEAALRVEIGLGAGLPLSLRIPLEAAPGGVHAVTVTLREGELDVCLVRGAESAGLTSAAATAAVQALADRLRTRFGGRTIRVSEVTASTERAEAGAAPSDAVRRADS